MRLGDNFGVSTFHKVITETDSIYQKLQKYSGLSDAEFWSFVAIRLDGCKHQHEICSWMLMNRQTVSTALKQLIKKGFVQQTLSEENQRLKYLSITSEGEDFAKRYIDIVREAEQDSWQCLSSKEQETLIKLCSKLNHFLDIEAEKVIKNTL